MRALEALSQPLEVLEVDILWPRWVARIGPTGASLVGPPEGGREQGGEGVGAVGRGLGCVWLILAFRGGASGTASPAQPYVFPSSLEAASRPREEHSSAYVSIAIGERAI